MFQMQRTKLPLKQQGIEPSRGADRQSDWLATRHHAHEPEYSPAVRSISRLYRPLRQTCKTNSPGKAKSGNHLDNSRRASCDDGLFWDILCDDRTGSDDCIVTDRHAGKYGYVGAYPYIPADNNWRRINRIALFGRKPVVQGAKGDVLTDLLSIADRDAAKILKGTSCVQKHFFSKGDVFPAVRIEGRKEKTRFETSFPVNRENSARTSAGSW